MQEAPLYYSKVGVWCAINGYRIIGPFFYEETINSARYISHILGPLCNELSCFALSVIVLKNKVYKTNPHTLNEKETIQTTIRSIMVEELVRVKNNFLKRCETCIQENWKAHTASSVSRVSTKS